MQIAIIGAGWAGLSAAIKLHQNGHNVTIYEAARQMGGRARPIEITNLDTTIDNGQHILIGAYHECFKLMRSLGIDPGQVLHRETLDIQATDKRLRLSFFNLPAPFNQLGLFIKSRGINGFTGRLFFIKLAAELHKTQKLQDDNAAAWLRRLGCPDELIKKLWEPLCIATTNTSIQNTDTNIFATVLRDSLLKKASDSDIYIPKALLADLWAKKAVNILGDRVKYKFIRNINTDADDHWHIDGQVFDQLIIATSYDTAKKLIAQLPGSAEYLANWQKLSFSAIGTLTLKLAQPWLYKPAMSLLYDNPDQDAWGQWLFNRNTTANDPGHRNLVHVVIGQAQRYTGIDNAVITNGVIKQIQQQAEIPLPDILEHALVTEKKATFDAIPGLVRPDSVTPWPGLYLAGDWTSTGYPAVLEGAVRSGFKAAGLCK